MSQKDLVIFGVGQVAEVIHYYFTREAKRNVVAFTVDQEYRTADTLLEIPVIDFEEIETRFPPKDFEIFVGMSFRGVNKFRTQKVAEVKDKGYTLASHASPNASIWDGFELHENTIIMDNNVIQAYASVGQNVIMWSGNHLGHHSTIEDNCFVASHAVISGGVTIGASSFVGVNVTIRDNVSIGTEAVLGAGSLILNDAPDRAVFMGPATEMSRVPSNRLRNI